MKILPYLLTLVLLMPGLARAQPSMDEGAFHQAALSGDLAAVRTLLATGIAVDVRDPEERTALMWAGFNGHVGVIAFLVENGADVDALDGNGRTALMYASSGPFAEAVGLLLDQGADVNVQGSLEGFTPLMTAAAEGQVEVVEVLLAHGADPDLEDLDGDTAESFAEQNGHDQVVNALRQPPPPANEP